MSLLRPTYVEELFALLHFLDPIRFRDPRALSAKFTAAAVKEDEDAGEQQADKEGEDEDDKDTDNDTDKKKQRGRGGRAGGGSKADGVAASPSNNNNNNNKSGGGGGGGKNDNDVVGSPVGGVAGEDAVRATHVKLNPRLDSSRFQHLILERIQQCFQLEPFLVMWRACASTPRRFSSRASTGCWGGTCCGASR